MPPTPCACWTPAPRCVLEKPLCRTLDEADRIVDAAAAAHGERLLYAENLAYAPAIVELVGRAATLGRLTPSGGPHHPVVADMG